jgi:DNA topoisomerase I
MSKNLVIVESPAKAKTIEGFLGKDYTVKSSYGHVRDLKKKGISIDIQNGFKPEYEVSEDKKQVVAELKKLAKAAEMVWLATDEDREGEAISWHLEEALSLVKSKTKRIVFHEITKSAIHKAIENPRQVDNHLVDAQQARRVLDRLVGFELSPILWRKVKPSLSAGRVQSVTVRLIVEREREVNAFVSEASYRTVALFNIGSAFFKAELPKKFKIKEDALAFLNECIESNYQVADLEKKPAKKTPAAPFTTSTLQQEAGRKLGYSVTQTMIVAQKLYEEGKITYMRTDSVNLSDTALNAAKDEITKSFGEKYSKTRKFTTKSKGAQEAHEAIRPVDMGVQEIDGDNGGKKLYDLIWKRTLASQMADAELEKTVVKIDISNSKEQFIARGEVLKFEGFLKVYMESSDDENDENSEGMLPAMKKGDVLKMDNITVTQRFSYHPARYSESSLVKKLEELGIGRPSTYAPTITTVQKRGYVVKEDREGYVRKYEQMVLKNEIIKEEIKEENTGAEKAKLFPTDIGIVVNDFLVTHFGTILSYDFTATVEKQFDEIAEGQLKWPDMIGKFYTPFHIDVENTLENSQKATGARELGIDPASGKKVYARIGRFGAMIQIGEQEDEDKPKFASLKKEQSITSISFEEAMELFKLPRNLGLFEEKETSVAIGRFGPFIKHDGKFISINVKNGDDPMTMSLERAVELIETKRQSEIDNLIKKFSEDSTIQIIKGRFGPYIKAGTKNVKIPKDKVPESLTFEEVKDLVENAPKTPAKRRFTKKA